MADRIDTVNDAWYQYRNILGVPSRWRIICGIVAICFILTLVVIPFTFLSKNSSPKSVTLQSFKAFQSALNTSVDPCVDFYDFSCGLWSKEQKIPVGKLRLTTFNVLQNAINDKKLEILQSATENEDFPSVVNSAIHFYNLCVYRNESLDNDFEAIFEFLKPIGNFPIAGRIDFDETLFDWINATAFLNKNLDLNIIFDTSLKHLNRGENLIYVNTPEPLLFEHTMLGMVFVNLNSSNAQFDLQMVVENANKLEEIYNSVNISDSVSTLTVGDLIEQVPEVDWLRYFHIMYHDMLLEMNESISLQDIVVVESMDYVRKIGRILSSDVFSKLELAHLFGSAVVFKIWVLIPNVLQDYNKLFHFEDASEIQVAKTHCFTIINDIFSCSLDYLYMKNSSFLEFRDSETLTNYVKSAFYNILQDSEWIDTVSKEAALIKLMEMTEVIGVPSYMKDKTEFDLFYHDFPLVSRNILKSFFQIIEYYTHFIELHVPRSITDVSAYYIPDKNKFVFPISLHNPPFYYQNGPSYLNFGAIGAIIAHEMMHGFGTFEDYFKKSIVSVFTNDTNAIFINHTHCFVKQYDQFGANGLHKNNGTSTLRENVADSEGLRIAFQAYKKYVADFGYKYKVFDDYSSDQIFFISYGAMWCYKGEPNLSQDIHSFPELRVNGAVSNLKSFAYAFNCPENSPMNPVNKCTIW